jgi:hypothetical protein
MPLSDIFFFLAGGADACKALAILLEISAAEGGLTPTNFSIVDMPWLHQKTA